MERATLIAILERAEGAEPDGGAGGTANARGFRTKEGHELTLYLGRPGSAMPVQHVLGLVLEDQYACVEARERGTLYTTFEAIHGLLDSRKKAGKGGGGGVGF